MVIYFVDVEASSLGSASFPVEVAWVGDDGVGEDHLIRPADAWLAGGCPGWSMDSQRVHGIGLDRLVAEGSPARDVAGRVALVLSARDANVFSDAKCHDGRWLETLLIAGERTERVAVRPVREAYAEACRRLFSPARLEGPRRETEEGWARAVARKVIARAVEAEALRPGTRHRALPDAERLWRTWRAIREEVACLGWGSASEVSGPRRPMDS